MSLSEKYIFLAKVQMTLDNASRVCSEIENDAKRNADSKEKEKGEEEEGVDNNRRYDDECPVCYERLSKRCKVVPLCGHEICHICYVGLLSVSVCPLSAGIRCVLCRELMNK